MENLLSTNTQEIFSSLELTNLINEFRAKEGNKKILIHKDFLKVIRDEFEEEIHEGDISPMFQTVEIGNGAKRQSPYYNLTISQAKQVLVRESKFVRKAVIQYLEKLEERVKQSISPFGQFANQIPTTLSDALLLAGNLAKENEQLLEENQQQKTLIEEYKPKAERLDNMTKHVDGITLGDFSKMMIDKHHLDEKGIEIKDIYRWFREKEFTCKGRYKFNKPKKHTILNGYMTLKTIGVNALGKDKTIGVITPNGVYFFEFLILRDIEAKDNWGWR